jgi:ABC-type polar amino acid transport system ATPase subunit
MIILMSIRKKMGMVFQSFNLFNNLDIIDNITLAPIKQKIDKDVAIKEAREF